MTRDIDPATKADEAGIGPAQTGAQTQWLTLWLTLLAVVLALTLLAPGVVPITEMEHDVLHLMDAIARRDAGQLAHVDFMTPMGDLGIEMMAFWRRVFDLPFGMSMLMGNVAAVAMTLPLAIWAGASRLGLRAGLALGAWSLLMAAALSWRVDGAATTFAMSYNRWSWALAAPLLTLFLAPPRDPGRRTDLIDAIAIGLSAAALAWIKVSYAAALLPVWALWAVLTGRMRAAAWSAAIGGVAFLGFAAALTGSLGGAVTQVAAYAADLLFVAGSTLRPSPGVAPLHLLASPGHAAGAFACMMAAVILLAARLRALAAVWLAALFAITMMSWQNFGNDLLGVVAFGAAMPAAAAMVARAAPDLKVAGRPAGVALRALAGLVFVLGLQQVLFMQHTVAAGWRVSLGRTDAPLAYIGAPDLRFDKSVSGIVGALTMQRAETAVDPDALTGRERVVLGFKGEREIMGIPMPECQIRHGWAQMWQELKTAWDARPDLAGRTVIGADVINPGWLLLGAPPQVGAPIWHYDALGPALAAADLLAVSRCPVSSLDRNMILDEAVVAGLPLRRVLSTDFWEVFEIGDAPR
jgi:hypothetical protein